MPYISKSNRSYFDPAIKEIGTPFSAGELNYVITKVCDNYLHSRVNIGYRELNEVIGVLECAKQEFYRRVCAPYEDKKKEQYGDVYKGESE